MHHVVFSGHRPRRLGRTQAEIDNFCLWAIPNLPFKIEHAYIGMALGLDQGAALACLANDIPYTAAIPYRGFESHWAPDVQECYNELVKAAAKVCVVCPGGFHVSKLFARNRWMVDMARVYGNKALVYLWDGMEKGGTWDTIQQAQAWDLEELNLWSMWGTYFNGRR